MGIDTSILNKWICRLYLKATFPFKMVEIKAQQIPNKQRDQKYSTSAKPTGRPTEVKQCLEYNYINKVHIKNTYTQRKTCLPFKMVQIKAQQSESELEAKYMYIQIVLSIPVDHQKCRGIYSTETLTHPNMIPVYNVALCFSQIRINKC